MEVRCKTEQFTYIIAQAMQEPRYPGKLMLYVYRQWPCNYLNIDTRNLLILLLISTQDRIDYWAFTFVKDVSTCSAF